MHKLRPLAPALLLMAKGAFALHFAAYGDTRTNPDIHQTVVNGISKVNPELVLFSGDLWDGYGATVAESQAKFKSILTKNANIALLLQKNLYLVSRGNHESETDLLSFQPTLVRGGKPVYAFSQGNCFFVSLAMDPMVSLAFLETQLQSDAARKAAWKFVFSHYPVYSTGAHGAKGLPALEQLCDKYGVNVVFNGHDHMYERTNQIFGGKVVDSTNRLSASKGTVYIVSGGGGAPLYAVGKQWWTRFSKSANNFLDVKADSTRLTVTALLPDGSQLDQFTVDKATVPLSAQAARPGAPGMEAVNLADRGLELLSFDPAPAADAFIEIRSHDGTRVARENLAPGQTRWAWDYSRAAQGEYVAVIQAGGASRSRAFAVVKR